MLTTTYLQKCVKKAKERLRLKDYLINTYLSSAEVDKAIMELKLK